jgi:hypothetical protein
MYMKFIIHRTYDNHVSKTENGAKLLSKRLVQKVWSQKKEAYTETHFTLKDTPVIDIRVSYDGRYVAQEVAYIKLCGWLCSAYC